MATLRYVGPGWTADGAAAQAAKIEANAATLRKAGNEAAALRSLDTAASWRAVSSYLAGGGQAGLVRVARTPQATIDAAAGVVRYPETNTIVQVRPPLPHPDASNLALGPNLGGRDGVIDTPTTATAMGGAQAPGSAGGLLLIGGLGLLFILLLKKK